MHFRDNVLADALSRLPQKTDESSQAIPVSVKAITSSIGITMKSIAERTSDDSEMKNFRALVNNPRMPPPKKAGARTQVLIRVRSDIRRSHIIFHRVEAWFYPYRSSGECYKKHTKVIQASRA